MDLPGKGNEEVEFTADILGVDDVMVSRLVAEVERLRSQNLSLTSDKTLLAKEKEELRRTEEKGDSALHYVF